MQGAVEIPYVLLQTIIYSLITYSMIQFEWTAGTLHLLMLYVYEHYLSNLVLLIIFAI